MERKTFKVVNVYVTGNTSSGENQVSRHDMLSWFFDCLQMEIRDIVELGKGYHYCQMLNLLFPSVNAVPLKNVKFGAKSEHEYTENWKKLQNGFKKLEVDKVIPIEKLIKLKMMDNMEFAQWFKKFFDANTGQCFSLPVPDSIHSTFEQNVDYLEGIDDCFGQYDATYERKRANAAGPVPAAGGKPVTTRKPAPPAAAAGSGLKPMGTTTKPAASGAQPRTSAQSGGVPKRSPATQNGNVATSTAPAKKPTVNQVQQQMRDTRLSGDGNSQASAPDAQLINDLKAQLEEANAQIDGSANVIEGLEKERDFYFSKLRDIEILTQEHEESGQLPDENVLKRIRDILYATEDGFIAPEDEEEEGLGDDGEYQGEAVPLQDDDETY